MPEECVQVNTPVLNTTQDPCKGEQKILACIYSPAEIVALQLPANSNLSQIINAMLVKIGALEDRIVILETP